MNNSIVKNKEALFKDCLDFAFNRMVKVNFFNSPEEICQDDMCKIRDKLKEIIIDSTSYDETIYKLRFSLLSYISFFAKTSLSFSFKHSDTHYPALNHYLKNEMPQRLDEVKDVDEYYEKAYLSVEKKIVKFNLQESAHQLVCVIASNQAERINIYMQTLNYLREVLGDVIWDENGDVDKSKDWFEPALLSVCIYVQNEVKKLLNEPSHLSVNEEKLFSSWGDVVVFPGKDYLAHWNDMWENLTNKKSPFLN